MIDRTFARLPPTARTMSAKTVVVVTTGIASASTEGPTVSVAARLPGEHPTTRSASMIADALRPSLSPGRAPRRPLTIGSVRRLGLAASAETEQLQPVRVDPESARSLDLANRLVQPRIVDLGGPSAARTDDVVVMRPGARDVDMISAREVQPLDDA